MTSGGDISVRDIKTGKVHPCPVGRILVVGRVNSNQPVDIGCEDPYVSRKHCEFCAPPDGRLQIRAHSSAGTSLNGVGLKEGGIAAPGDRIVLAGSVPKDMTVY